MIIGHQDQSFDVLFLVNGHARVNIYSLMGKRVSFREIRRVRFFGELSELIDRHPRSASVEAITACSAIVVPRQAFLKTVQEEPVFMLSVMVTHDRHKVAYGTRRFEFSTLAVRNRVHAELLRIAGDAGGGNEAVYRRRRPMKKSQAGSARTGRPYPRQLARLEEMGLHSQGEPRAAHRRSDGTSSPVEQGTLE